MYIILVQAATRSRVYAPPLRPETCGHVYKIQSSHSQQKTRRVDSWSARWKPPSQEEAQQSLGLGSKERWA